MPSSLVEISPLPSAVNASRVIGPLCGDRCLGLSLTGSFDNFQSTDLAIAAADGHPVGCRRVKRQCTGWHPGCAGQHRGFGWQSVLQVPESGAALRRR